MGAGKIGGNRIRFKTNKQRDLIFHRSNDEILTAQSARHAAPGLPSETRILRLIAVDNNDN